jgi:CDP-paratose 2-epimerase
MKIALVTGSAGLIGHQSCLFFSKKGFKIVGIDNDMRSYFFGAESSTKNTANSLKSDLKDYDHYNIDIRDYNGIENIFKKYNTDIEIVIHTAAQPSHDWAAKDPLTDFTVNALGTINLLEFTRRFCPKATFIFTSTNKVYGDRPNYLDLVELEMRYEIDPKSYKINDFIGNDGGINELMSIDNTKHSIFGSSKVAADIMCQEYGKYFDMNVGVFRGGCLTGPNHAGSELHGFLSYLVKCVVHNKPYTIFGNKGKQVRDNIHSLDLVNMFWHFFQNPKKGEVYNAGGGRENSTSILEAIDTINNISGKQWNNFTISEIPRIGDHIWYISDITKFKKDYPNWNITITLDETIKQMIDHEKNNFL